MMRKWTQKGKYFSISSKEQYGPPSPYLLFATENRVQN